MSASAGSPVEEHPDARGHLREKDFLLLCVARFGVNFSSQAMMVAVGAYIYEVTRDPFALGLVGLATFLPAIALTLFVGLVADSFDRRLVLAGCCSVMTVAMLLQILNMGSGLNSAALVYLAVIIYGTGRAFFQPATAALLPAIVKPHQFTNAIATGQVVSQTATITGPAAGGFLYWIDPILPFWLAFACFSVSVASHLLMAPRPVTPGKSAGAAWPQLIAGFTYMWGKPVVFGAIVLDMLAVVMGGAVGLLPLYAQDILQVDARGLGALRSAPAIGGLLASAYVARHMFVERHSGFYLLASITVWGVAIVVFGFSTSFLLSFLALAVTGAADMISVVIRLTMVQAETPDELRGRVAAVNSVFTSFSNEIGQFRAGIMAGLIGAVPTVVLGGLGAIALTWAWGRWFPEIANRDHLVTPGSQTKT